MSRKTAAESSTALPGMRVAAYGSAPAEVVLLKGEAGAADLSAGRVLAGEDAEAAHKALSALGWDASVFAICSRQPDGALSPDSIKLMVEAVDPDLVVALDDVAAVDLAEAFGLNGLGFGKPERVAGRVILAVDGLEASLSDEKRKRRVWSQLKSIRRE
ncbi:MAG: hypothetical protein JXE06_08570 [Coriobacteriia bacterium]|nr:hypothetical protein [Coriobacteriia bacterium]MBN2822918.1 hypothetical protein [Coriobacteriia bacterium]